MYAATLITVFSEWLNANLIALAALIVSLLIYRRQRTIDNENHFFAFKLERYTLIITDATQTLDNYFNALLELRDAERGLFSDSTYLEKLMDEAENSLDSFRITIQKCGAFIPNEVVEQLDEWYNTLSDSQDIALDNKSNRTRKLAEIATADKLEDSLEKITNDMRRDLGIEMINFRLKKRSN